MKKKISVLSQANSTLIRLVSKDLIGFVKRMDKKRMSDFQLEMAKWFCENKNYAMSYIALSECVATKIRELEGIDDKYGTDKNQAEHAKDILYTHAEYRHLYELYKSPNKIRNNIAHQLPGRKDSTISDIKNLKNSIDKIEKEFKTFSGAE